MQYQNYLEFLNDFPIEPYGVLTVFSIPFKNIHKYIQNITYHPFTYSQFQLNQYRQNITQCLLEDKNLLSQGNFIPPPNIVHLTQDYLQTKKSLSLPFLQNHKLLNYIELFKIRTFAFQSLDYYRLKQSQELILFPFFVFQLQRPQSRERILLQLDFLQQTIEEVNSQGQLIKGYNFIEVKGCTQGFQQNQIIIKIGQNIEKYLVKYNIKNKLINSLFDLVIYMARKNHQTQIINPNFLTEKYVKSIIKKPQVQLVESDFLIPPMLLLVCSVIVTRQKRERECLMSVGYNNIVFHTFKKGSIKILGLVPILQRLNIIGIEQGQQNDLCLNVGNQKLKIQFLHNLKPKFVSIFKHILKQQIYVYPIIIVYTGSNRQLFKIKNKRFNLLNKRIKKKHFEMQVLQNQLQVINQEQFVRSEKRISFTRQTRSQDRLPK